MLAAPAPPPNTYEAIYASAWHHPGLCWLAAPLILAALCLRRTGGRRLLRLALYAELLIVFDAFCTGAWSPLPATAPLSVALAVLWVMVGDLRYFFLVEYYAPPPGPGRPPRLAGALLRAGMWSFFLPTLSYATQQLLPHLLPSKRALFCIFELLFVALMLYFRAVLLPRRLAAQPGSSTARWLRRVTDFELWQYGLWAFSDLLILSGVQAALLLRLLPNALYYVAFVPFAYFTAPAALRGERDGGAR